MTAHVPAVVEQHRQEIAVAQAGGDIAAANLAYSLELQSLAAAVGQPAPGQALVLAPVPAEACEAVLGALAAMEPEGAVSLRRDWPGREMGQNLAYYGWAVGRYGAGIEPDNERQFLYLGITMAMQIHADLHPGETLAPLPMETVGQFLAEYDPPEADFIRNWLGKDIALHLGAVSWLLRTYGAGITLDSEANMLRLGAAIGRDVFHDLQGARQPNTTTTKGKKQMIETANEAVADTKRDFEKRIAQAQAEGNSKLANQIYEEEMDWLGEYFGNGPIVGSQGRTA